MILQKVCQDLIKQNVSTIEFRHQFGMIFDDRGAVDLQDEILIFQQVEQKMQIQKRGFKIKVICTKGNDKLAEEYFVDENFEQLVAAFEDLDQDLIHYSKDKAIRNGQDFPVILSDPYDAILLDSKRMINGHEIVFNPKLMEIVRENQITVQCCPYSDLVMGVCVDLRFHPARTLFMHGIKLAISSDMPGF